MKIKPILLAAAVTLAFSSQGYARGTATGTVSKITASGSVTNIFLSNDITAVNGESVPACSNRDDYFTLASVQKNQLAVILTAMALGSSVKINGSGTCTNNSSVEDVASIQVIGS